jgi:hypothetical protein
MIKTTTNPQAQRFIDELSRLAMQKRKISAQRRRLHERIDRIHLSSPLGDADVARLDELEELARRVSERRLRLHREIDPLRAKIGLPPWRESRDLGDAA